MKRKLITETKKLSKHKKNFVSFHGLKITQKRTLLKSKMDQMEKKRWHEIIDNIPFKQKIAETMYQYLNDRKGTDLKRHLLKQRILEQVEIGMFDAIAEEAECLLNNAVNKVG